MGLNLRKWFRKSKKVVDPQKNIESADVAMSELAASLRGEIQGLVVEIKQLKREREGLFRDIHDIMLSKCQGGPLLGESSPPPSLPLLHRKRSTQTLWLPTTPSPPAFEDDVTDEVEMGLFGPRSRVPSIIDSPSSALAPGSDSANNASGSASQLSSPSSARQHTLRSTSEASQSSNNSDVPTTPTRTAWRVVEKKPAPIYVARTGTAAS